jgi:AcrR family transcriptional regulator
MLRKRIPKDAPDTRTSLMDAAERLFSEHGVESTSVRDIVKEAGANLGSITYHFGSKDHLALEVFARRLGPVNRARLARIDALEAEAEGGAVKLESIIEAMIRPTVEDETNGCRRKVEFIKLVSRCFQERHEEVQAFMSQHFDEVVQRFDNAILRAVPGLQKEELFWQMTFLMGALHHALERWADNEASPVPPWLNREKLWPDREGFIQRFVTFAVAGLRSASNETHP